MASGQTTFVEDADDGGVVADGAGEGDRLVGEVLATLEVAGEGELGAEGGEQQGPGWVVAGDSLERELEDVDPVAVDDAGGGVQALVVGEGGGGEPVGVAEVGGLSGGGEEGLAELGVPGLALGDAEPDAQVHVEQRVGLGALLVEVEGLGVVAQGVAGGEGGEARRRRPGGCSARALGRASGRGAADQWRASSPTRGPGRSPHSASSAAATWRWARAWRVRPNWAYRVCWMRACTKL